MSEEEIIKILNSYTTDLYHSYKEDIILKAIRGLLDLYNKEKEKNKILENLLQGKLYELYLYYKELAGSYQANSISKDKIRNKIKELEEEKSGMTRAIINNYATLSETIINNKISVLQDLL